MSTSGVRRDRMRPFADLTSFSAALDVALGLAVPIEDHRPLPLTQAAGRVLARPVVAPVDVPGADRAAMDGYAVRSADVSGAGPESAVLLRCVSRLLAGRQPDTPVGEGECVEIATGAPLPSGADAVVPVEETLEQDRAVAVLRGGEPGTHVSRRGEDLREGDRLAEADDILTPSRVAALASIGVESVQVWRRPRVLLVPTGDEVVPPGGGLKPGQVYDSNSVALKALVEENGAVGERADIVSDASMSLARVLDRPDVDLVVTLGGTSVGRHDLVHEAVSAQGDVLVHGVAVKPGKPLMLARVGDRPIIGLPGFPTSCLLIGYTVLEPMVRRLGRRPGQHRVRKTAILAENIVSPPGKRQFLTVALDNDRAVPAYRASSTITSMSTADGWIDIAPATEQLAAGTDVEVILF